MSAPPPAPLGGSPEAIGKADYLETVIQDITSMLGITSGLWQASARGQGLRLHPAYIHPIRDPNCTVIKFVFT